MKYILVYDSDCGPCARFRNAVGFLDARRKIRYVGLVEADLKGMLDSVPPAKRWSSFHLVTPSGGVLSGAKAIPRLAALLPGGKIASEMMGSSPVVMGAVGFLYSNLSRLHGSGSCSYSGAASS